MDLTVGGKLKTKGGTITSSAPAEKNHLRVAGIEAENIENHSHISVENASVGVSTQMGANVVNAIGASLNALTNLRDNDHTTTRSTVGSNITLDVGDGNIPTALSRDASSSNQQVKQFDKQDYQERAEMAQVISAVSDNTITLTLKPKLDDAEKVLNNDQATEAEKAQARQVVETYGKGSAIQLAIRAVTAAAQGLATGSAASAAVGGASPFLNKAIKQATTDENGQVNQSANLLAHAVLGAAEALATGNNALAGAAGAATGEVAAKLITERLYNTTPDKLSEAQKDTVSALSQLASGLSGVLAGDNTASGITAAQSGKSAVENNNLALAVTRGCTAISVCRNKVAKEIVEYGVKVGITGVIASEIADNLSQEDFDHFITLFLMGNQEIMTKYMYYLESKYSENTNQLPNHTGENRLDPLSIPVDLVGGKQPINTDLPDHTGGNNEVNIPINNNGNKIYEKGKNDHVLSGGKVSVGSWQDNILESRNKDTIESAQKLGYKHRIPPQKAPFNSHGQPVYWNGKNYITPDIDGHNVTDGWKMFDKKGRRQGTYDKDLNRIKD